MTMKNKSLLLSLVGVLLAASALTALAAGPLTPPGTPGDGSNGGPSLTEVKAAVDALQASDGRTRIPAQTNTYTISQPGNYVLTGNITVASGDGINITASNVTIDLNGFTITSTVTPAAGTGIRVSNTSRNIRIHNGQITSGFTTPGNLPAPGPGFSFGIQLAVAVGSTSDNLVFEDLYIVGINGLAIAPTNTAVAATMHNVVARRVVVDGQSGIIFALGGSSTFGKIIDCDVKTISATVSVAAGLVGQTTAQNTGGGSAFSALVDFNNH
ncbi:MAG: hypothetical protein RL380_1751 [Verrucomicrobiota bacterium]|jgi:hypothetical protein